MVLNVSVHADFPIILALSGYMHNIITRNFMFVTLSAVDNNSTESLHSLKMYDPQHMLELLQKAIYQY